MGVCADKSQVGEYQRETIQKDATLQNVGQQDVAQQVGAEPAKSAAPLSKSDRRAPEKSSKEKSRKKKSKSGLRSEVVIPGALAFYHCWARCVRQSWLWGRDAYSGIDYSHRRGWIQSFVQQLAGLVGMDIGWYAVLANHMHFVLRARPDVVATWSDQEIARRYLTIQRLIKSHDGRSIDAPSDAEIILACKNAKKIAKWRSRLSHPSIFMGSLCEHIARRANKEDGCKGRFFDNRYGCRRLESTAAVLVCALYVDLNVVRAGEADTPENSRSTSAYWRIAELESRNLQAGVHGSPGELDASPVAPHALDAWLSPLELGQRSDAYPLVDAGSTTGLRASDRGLLPISLETYLELLDWPAAQRARTSKGKSPPIWRRFWSASA